MRTTAGPHPLVVPGRRNRNPLELMNAFIAGTNQVRRMSSGLLAPQVVVTVITDRTARLAP